MMHLKVSTVIGWKVTKSGTRLIMTKYSKKRNLLVFYLTEAFLFGNKPIMIKGKKLGS